MGIKPKRTTNPASEFGDSNALLLKTLNQVNTGIAVLDQAGNFIFVNEKYCDIYGFERDALIGNSFLVIIPEKEHALYLAEHGSISGLAEKTSGERRLKRGDGSTIDIQYTTENIFTAQGERNMIVTVYDISNVISIQQELSQNESKFRSMIEDTAAKSEETRKLIMNAALDAVICIDSHGDITFWNPQAEKIFGWKQDEVLGRKLSSIIIPEVYRERHDRGMDHYLKTGDGPALNVLLDLTAIKRSGEEFPIELTVLPIKQDDSDMLFCAFIRDITERKKHETALRDLNEQMSRNIEQLANSNIELEQFAYIASHDMQEPLRMVTSFLTQLDKKYHEQLDDKGKQYLHFAVDGATRMRKIILDLLEYSKVGKTEIKVERININDVVGDIVAVNKTAIDECNATVSIGELPVISAQRTSMQQLFHNLISNALKYHRENAAPEIGIAATEKDGFWEFSISDNGIGINDRYAEKIFVIFQRLHNREEYSGTGIGLAICKKIVEAHGGRIWVESVEGEGSTFYFTIQK
jgi:PAS domain S-box-containing protein